MEGFPGVCLVVVSDVDNEAAIGGFDGMELMVVAVMVAFPGWDGCEPLPCLAIVARFTDPDFFSFGPELFPGIEDATVRELGGAVGAVDDGGVALGPSDSAIG